MNVFAFSMGMPGPFEMIIMIILVGALVVVLGVVAIVVVVLRRAGSNPASNPNLIPCPDCGRYVSRLAPTCPQCGRSFTPQ